MQRRTEQPPIPTTIGYPKPIWGLKRLPLDILLCHPPVTLGGVRLYPDASTGIRRGPNFMQFSSRYDGRRLPARPPFSLARCFKSLVDWFDYAYAVLPAAAAWVRSPSFRLGEKHPPSVIHLRGLFSRDTLHITRPQDGKAPRSAMSRPLAKVALLAVLLAAGYLAFTVTSGGPSLASAPSEETPTLGAFSLHASADSMARKISEVVPPQADQSIPLATPVKTLQSSIEPQIAATVTAAETSAEAAHPISVAVAAPVATAAPEVHTAVAPLATPAPAVSPATRPASSYYTAPEIRAFAATAGWSAEHLDGVVQVAWCESTNNAAAVGGMGAHGLMQVMPFWFRVAGIDMASWSDPVSNLKVALVAFQTDIAESRAPWSAWDCKPGR